MKPSHPYRQCSRQYSLITVFQGSWQSCKIHDLPHEVLNGVELRKRFPGFQLPKDILAVLQPDGGFLMPERCIVSYVMAAQAHGAEIHGREQVLGWEPLGDGVRVTTDRGTYEADKLVITAGSWMSKVLPLVWPAPLTGLYPLLPYPDTPR